jgi:hypothetical protein
MAETSTGDATAGAVLEEAEDRDWGTSRDDVEAYAAAGGAAAGAAACAAVGAAPAAGLCATIGGWAAEFLAGTIYGWCTSSEEAERARERRREVRELHNRVVQIEAWDTLNGQSLQQRIDALRALHAELYPDDPWIDEGPDIAPQHREVYPAILMLARFGMPTEPRERGGVVMLGTPSLIAEWESLRQQMSDAELFDRLETRGTEISEAIERAYDRAVIALAAEGAGDQAETRATRPGIRAVTPPLRSTIFGAVSGVEPTGPGRVVVPRAYRTWRGAAVRLGAVVGSIGLACGVYAWRRRA